MTDSPPKMGRKPLPANQKRTCRKEMFLTPDEMDALVKAARKTGEDPAVFARRVVLERVARA